MNLSYICKHQRQSSLHLIYWIINMQTNPTYKFFIDDRRLISVEKSRDHHHHRSQNLGICKTFFLTCLRVFSYFIFYIFHTLSPFNIPSEGPEQLVFWNEVYKMVSFVTKLSQIAIFYHCLMPNKSCDQCWHYLQQQKSWFVVVWNVLRLMQFLEHFWSEIWGPE